MLSASTRACDSCSNPTIDPGMSERISVYLNRTSEWLVGGLIGLTVVCSTQKQKKSLLTLIMSICYCYMSQYTIADTGSEHLLVPFPNGSVLCQELFWSSGWCCRKPLLFVPDVRFLNCAMESLSCLHVLGNQESGVRRQTPNAKHSLYKCTAVVLSHRLWHGGIALAIRPVQLDSASGAVCPAQGTRHGVTRSQDPLCTKHMMVVVVVCWWTTAWVDMI